jgi:hypothetical protein
MALLIIAFLLVFAVGFGWGFGVRDMIITKMNEGQDDELRTDV